MQDFDSTFLDNLNEAIDKMKEAYDRQLVNSILKEKEFYVICGNKDVFIQLKEYFKDYEGCEVLYEKYCDPTKVYLMRKIDYTGV